MNEDLLHTGFFGLLSKLKRYVLKGVTTTF